MRGSLLGDPNELGVDAGELISIEVVTEILGFKGTSGVRAAVARGELQVDGRGARYRAFFRREDVLAFMTKRAARVDLRRSERGAERDKEELELSLKAPAVEEARPASSGSTSFGDVADRWWAEISSRKLEEDPSQTNLCPSTSERYQASLRDFLKPAFGEKNAKAIGIEDVRRWRNSIREVGYAPSTVNAHHRVLKSVLGSIGNRAANEVKELNERVGALITRKEPNRLDGAELDRFLGVARQRWPQHYALILVLFTTTMRISTALALRWEDLELDTMEIVVQRRRSGYGARAQTVPARRRLELPADDN